MKLALGLLPLILTMVSLSCTNFETQLSSQMNLVDANQWSCEIEAALGLTKAPIYSKAGMVDFSALIATVPAPIESLVARTRVLSAKSEYSLSFTAKGQFELWLDDRMIFQNYQPFAIPLQKEELWLSLSAGFHQLVLRSKHPSPKFSFQAILRPLDPQRLGKQTSSYRVLNLGFPGTGAVSAKDRLTFRATTNPVSDIVLPIVWYLKDSKGNILDQGKTISGVWSSIALPSGADRFLRLHAEIDQSAQTITKPEHVRLRNLDVWRLFCQGDFDKVGAQTSSRARLVSSGLADSNKQDWKPSLAFLADRIDARLSSSLLSAELIELAVAFVEDILEAIENPRSADSLVLTGYRQMAWFSAIDDSVQPYSIYLPLNYSPEKNYKLLFFLHGFGSNDFVAVRSLVEAKPDDFIVVSPYSRGDMYYKLMAEQEVLDLLAHVLKRYPIDQNRLYLAGESMGGFGAWQIGQNFADKFAAIVPIMGGGNTLMSENLKNLPVFAIHGNSDDIVDVSFSRNIVRDLQNRGFLVRYDELANVGHHALGSWLDEHGPQQFFSYLRQFKYPELVENFSVRMASARYGRHHWLTVEEIDHKQDESELALVEGSRLSDDHLSLKTNKVRAFKLNLTKAQVSKSKNLSLTVDGTTLEVMPEALKSDFVHLYRAGDKQQWQLELPSDLLVLRHDETGFASLFRKNLIVVYGTKSGVGDRLKIDALLLADWGPGMLYDGLGVKTAKIRVMSDAEFSPNLLESNSVLLLGDETLNSVTKTVSEHAMSLWRDIYKEGVFSFGGVSLEKADLALVQPNPYNRSRIIALFHVSEDFFSSSDQQLAWHRDFKYWLCGYKTGQSRRSLTLNPAIPDIMLLGRQADRPTWKGWYDRNWQNLDGK